MTVFIEVTDAIKQPVVTQGHFVVVVGLVGFLFLQDWVDRTTVGIGWQTRRKDLVERCLLK